MNKYNDTILTLITAYVSNTINEKQLADLQEWLLKDAENKELFLEYLQFYKKSRSIGFTEMLDKEKAWNNILLQLQKPLIKIPKQINVDKKFIHKPWFKFASAACIMVFLAVVAFLKNSNNVEIVIEPVIANSIKIGSDKATLTLEDGLEIVLEKGQKYETQEVVSNGEEIVYKKPATNFEPEELKIANNLLTIPRGGQFQITLSDGTKVWLNSESQLKYPVSFLKGKSRKVELIYGEAYFDVSPSEKNNGSNFIVHHKMQDIEVLGTEFNIKAYKDETNIYTTLVEGKVKVNTKIEQQLLKPNQQVKLNTTVNSLAIYNIDVSDEVAWKNGVFSFERKSLEAIAKVLTRWYDVEFVFANEKLKSEKFIGRINKKTELEDVLSILKNTDKINDYKLINEKIILE